jgi:hypothetical protein
MFPTVPSEVHDGLTIRHNQPQWQGEVLSDVSLVDEDMI